MTSGLDPARLATAERVELTVTAFRHLSPRYDPRSGEGARIHGGRFNPPNSFPALYLCATRDCAIAELTRQGIRNVVGLEGLLPRAFYEYELRLRRVLDLTHPDVLEYVGLSPAQLTSDDWALCQEIGAAAHAGGDQAIRAPSATGVDQVIAVFTELVGTSLVRVDHVEEWNDLTDL